VSLNNTLVKVKVNAAEEFLKQNN